MLAVLTKMQHSGGHIQSSPACRFTQTQKHLVELWMTHRWKGRSWGQGTACHSECWASAPLLDQIQGVSAVFAMEVAT